MTTKGRPTQARKDEAKASTSPFPLTQELKTYEAHLPGWADRQGQFVLALASWCATRGRMHKIGG